MTEPSEDSYPPAPLVTICAPPGTGKTTVLRPLIDGARPDVVVDIDEILEDGALLGVPIATQEAAPVWPAYDRLWEKIAGLARRSGHRVIMLTQVPDVDVLRRNATAPGEVRFGWLIEDEVRRQRLSERGWTAAEIADSDQDAATLRENLPAKRLIRTRGDDVPGVAAERVLRAVRAVPVEKCG